MRRQGLKLFKLERTVIERRRQAETVLHQRLFARPVPAVHTADLRDRDVGLIDDQQTIGRQVVKQRRRRFARPAARQIARVVFNPRAVAQLVHHFEVELRTLAQTLLFQQLVVLQQSLTPLRQFNFNLFHRLDDTLARGDVVGFGINGEARDRRLNMTGQRIEQRQALNFLIEQLNAQRDIVRLRREDINHLAAHAEGTALEGLIVAGVLQLGQAAQNSALVDNHADRQMQHHFQIQIRIAQTVDSGDRGHHHHVATLQQRFGRRQTHLFNMFVHRRIFLDEGVRAWHVGFRLVVVVVRDEILHRVLREELFHFAV